MLFVEYFCWNIWTCWVQRVQILHVWLISYRWATVSKRKPPIFPTSSGCSHGDTLPPSAKETLFGITNQTLTTPVLMEGSKCSLTLWKSLLMLGLDLKSVLLYYGLTQIQQDARCANIFEQAAHGCTIPSVHLSIICPFPVGPHFPHKGHFIQLFRGSQSTSRSPERHGLILKEQKLQGCLYSVLCPFHWNSYYWHSWTVLAF